MRPSVRLSLCLVCICVFFFYSSRKLDTFIRISLNILNILHDCITLISSLILYLFIYSKLISFYYYSWIPNAKTNTTFHTCYTSVIHQTVNLKFPRLISLNTNHSVKCIVIWCILFFYFFSSYTSLQMNLTLWNVTHPITFSLFFLSLFLMSRDKLVLWHL